MEAALSEYIDCAVRLARQLHPLRAIRKDLELPLSKRIEDRKQAVMVAERFCKRPSMEMDVAEDDVYVNLSFYDDHYNWGDEP